MNLRIARVSVLHRPSSYELHTGADPLAIAVELQDVTWADASVEEHQEQIALTLRHIKDHERVIHLHELAIETIGVSGDRTLRAAADSGAKR
jgi:hypothetical protein